MADDWPRYIDAAKRKIEIAEYHCDQLKHALSNASVPHDWRPEIRTQACFEGVVVATIAAVDQIAQAVNSALNLHLASGKLFEGTLGEILERVPEYENWRQQPIGRDLRRLRTRMVHYSYTKSSNGPRWEVEVANEDYAGPRDLLGYAEATTAYAQELGSLAGKLETSLAASTKAGG